MVGHSMSDGYPRTVADRLEKHAVKSVDKAMQANGGMSSPLHVGRAAGIRFAISYVNALQQDACVKLRANLTRHAGDDEALQSQALDILLEHLDVVAPKVADEYRRTVGH